MKPENYSTTDSERVWLNLDAFWQINAHTFFLDIFIKPRSWNFTIDFDAALGSQS